MFGRETAHVVEKTLLTVPVSRDDWREPAVSKDGGGANGPIAYVVLADDGLAKPRKTRV